MHLQKPVFERSINKIDILNTTPEQEYFQVPLIHNNKLSSIENIEGFKTDIFLLHGIKALKNLTEPRIATK